MPHPRFKHQWEEDSYWKHYENYQEELALRKHDKKAEAEAKAKAEAQAKAQAKAEGWQTVGKGR
jgi:hypothetical protein